MGALFVTIAARLADRHAGSGSARGGHHNPDQVGRIPRAELFHDVGADGRGLPKQNAGLLVPVYDERARRLRTGSGNLTGQVSGADRAILI